MPPLREPLNPFGPSPGGPDPGGGNYLVPTSDLPPWLGLDPDVLEGDGVEPDVERHERVELVRDDALRKPA